MYDEFADPKLKEAMSDLQVQEWKKEVQLEIDALSESKAWILVKTPVNRIVIGCKCVLRTKFKSEGRI